MATGRPSDEREFAIGNECDGAGWVGIVRDALPTAAGKEVRLVVRCVGGTSSIGALGAERLLTAVERIGRVPEVFRELLDGRPAMKILMGCRA